MKIVRHSHNFVVSEIEPRFSNIVGKFARRYQEYEESTDPVTRKTVLKVLKTYAFWPKEADCIRFPISLYGEFYTSIRNFPDLMANLTVEDKIARMEDAADAGFKIKQIHTARDYQQTLIDDVLLLKILNYIITLPPGAGKTLTAFHILSLLKKRAFVMMRGGYLDRWIPDLEATFHLAGKKLLVVRGQSDLIALMEMQAEGSLEADLIISTIDTVSSYMEDYDEFPHIRDRYPYKPDEIFERLRIGILIFDEGHQNPHKAARVFSHANVPLSLTLSATLSTRNQFKNNMYRILYPESNRNDAGYKNVYIGVNALMYRMSTLKGIRTTGYKGAYNHVNFEQSLMLSKNRRLLSGYMGLVKYSIDLKFMKDYKPKTKCLLFFATVKMCDVAVKYLRDKYPHLKVGRYVSGDKMTVLQDCDFIVSTVLSAGTAVDIIDLRTTIMTTAIDSEISNQQSRGRTRPVKSYPDLTPEFCYFVCLDIPKHMQYHRNKKEFFHELVKYHVEVSLPFAA